MGNLLWRRMGAFVAPMIAGNVLQLLSGTASAAMLGRLAGANALASAGVLFPLTMLCYSFATGLTNGATIVLASEEGGKNADETQRLIVEALMLAVAGGIVFALAGLFLGARILQALGTPAIIFTQTLSYLRIVAVSMAVILPYMMYAALLDGLGDSNTPFFMLLVSTLLTLAAMPALIIGVAPLPHLGVLGAPAGALAAFTLVTLGTAFIVPRIHQEFHLPASGLRTLLPSIGTARKILRLGMPIALQYVAVSASQLVLLSIITAAGALPVAVYAAVNQVIDYVTTPISMISTAASAFAAKAIGARNLQEVPAITRTAILMMLLLTASMTLLAYAFAQPLLGLFLSVPAAAALAREALFALLWSVPVLGIGAIATAIVRSEQHAAGPMIANAVGVWLILLPCAKLLTAHHGIIGVWQAYPIAYLAIASMEVGYFALIWRRLQGRLQPHAV